MFIEILCPDIELLVLSVPAYINKLAKCQCTNDFMGMASRAYVALVAYYYESWEQWPRPFHEEMTTSPPETNSAFNQSRATGMRIVQLASMQNSFLRKMMMAGCVHLRTISIRYAVRQEVKDRGLFFHLWKWFLIGFHGYVSKCCKPNVYELQIAIGLGSLFQSV